jgi:CelD/BcsL family acetyltransferase involved in cellulose biosynthesis
MDPSGRERLSVVVIEAEEEVLPILHEWEKLAAEALIPNAFYEPWMLLPALRHLAEGEKIIFVLVYEQDRRLTGFFPLRIRPRSHLSPTAVLTMWQHKHCYLCAPLLHRDCAAPVLEAFFEWLRSSPYGCRLFDSGLFPADGQFQSILMETLTRVAHDCLVLASYPRALFARGVSAETHIEQSFSAKKRKEYRRQEKRLSECGELTYQSAVTEAELKEWLDTFLRVESEGWKGEEGVSFSYSSSSRAFLYEMLVEAHLKGRLVLLTMRLNGRPIALKCNLLTADGGFAFIITYQEAYAKFSPGVLLELENLREMYADPGLQWMDSCARVNHPMINRVWRERRMVQRMIVSDQSRWGDLLLALIPLLRWVRESVRRLRAPDQKLPSADPTRIEVTHGS